MISPRAVAVQGFGFTPKLVSVQGLQPWQDEPNPNPHKALALAILQDSENRRRRQKRRRDEDALFLTAF